jgi:hypothetical protein
MNFCGKGKLFEKCLITVDSGTTMLSVPSAALKPLMDIIPTNGHALDC